MQVIKYTMIHMLINILITYHNPITNPILCQFHKWKCMSRKLFVVYNYCRKSKVYYRFYT